MPWPATHILVAHKLHSQYFNDHDLETFIIGTCFPDIRYPGRVDRNKTHIKHLSLCEIQAAPSFFAGLYFHSLVDHLWNIHLQDHKDQVFQRFPHNTPIIHTMKILQDVSLYKKLSDWEPIWHYFETILPQELQFGVSEGMVRLWHTTLSTYLRKPPDISDLEMLRMSLPGEMVEQIGKYYTTYRDDPFLKRFLRAFYDRIDPLIEHYAAQDLAS